MKGVILAAGNGSRLRPLTLETPKPLLELGGRPLIQYPLDALMSSGITEITIVVGYLADTVITALKEDYPSLTFVYNDHYRDGGNAMSIYAARSFVEDSTFVVCMGDHAISPEIIQRLLAEHDGECVLCVDEEAWHPSQINDATRALIWPSGYIDKLGKELKVWNAIDTGVFQMTSEIFPAIEKLMEKQGVDVSITNMVSYLGMVGRPFTTCNVSGRFWADVDTLEDYKSIDSLLRETHGKRV